jgi:DNA modification methylase
VTKAEKPIPIRGEQIDLEEAIAAAPAYKDENVTLHLGDCLEVLRFLPDISVDSIVTDPPAGIEFMGKEWDSFRGDSRQRGGTTFHETDYSNRAKVRHGTTASYGNDLHKVRANFIASIAAVMAECLRVLKPGGHALVWAIPRTSHWTATAIEDAGFEIRDVITHHFGSGFPKSLDVSKAIDKSTVRDRETAELKFRGFMDDIYRVTAFIREARDKAGKSNADIDGLFGFVGMAGHWTSSKSQPAVPQWDQWLKLKELLAFGDDMDAEVWRLNGRKGEGWKSLEDTAYAEREVTGQHDRAPAAQTWKANYGLEADLEPKERRDVAATDAAAEWQGWGTALKPASEHWILARRPLAETNVAANVLKHGTGALNIDGCRIGNEMRPVLVRTETVVAPTATRGRTTGATASGERTRLGRWPADLALSHSASCDEAICATDCPVAELDRQSGEAGGAAPASGPTLTGSSESVARGRFNGTEATAFYGDRGGASRFFYTAKASPSERNAGLDGMPARVQGTYGGVEDDMPKDMKIVQPRANVHPTVKSTDLMRWLCRLITPKRGVVLDPFMGSGSTGVAAKLEDFRFIGIEREAEYMEIAKRRLGWAVAQPELFDLDESAA